MRCKDPQRNHCIGARCMPPQARRIFQCLVRDGSLPRNTSYRLWLRSMGSTPAVRLDRLQQLVFSHGFDECHRAMPDQPPPTNDTSWCDQRRRDAFLDEPRPRLVQWRRVLRRMTRYLGGRVPRDMASLTLQQLNTYVDIIGREFFGATYVPFLREHGWILKRENPDPRWNPDIKPENPALSGMQTPRKSKGGPSILVTQLIPGIIDHQWRLNPHAIRNDGNRMCSKLEWLGRVIAHELVHIYQMMLCKPEANSGEGRSIGHGPPFVQLNNAITGANNDFRWLRG